MKVVRSKAELVYPKRASVGFVPTMGAFHEGHLSLMRESARQNDLTVVSLFVNPTQFAPHEDFSKYPRDENRDAELAADAGADVLFAPPIEEVYPRRTTEVRVSGVSELYEGQARPTHFVGVATVVLKLFHMVRPDRAYFGLKDLQQCAVVRRMVEDLDVPVQLEFVKTVREVDGLAMSSRNVYLTERDRKVAPLMYRTLVEVADAIRVSGSASATSGYLASAANALNRVGFEVQYLDMVDDRTMEPVSSPNGTSRLIIAARLGNIRLIDNVPV